MCNQGLKHQGFRDPIVSIILINLSASQSHGGAHVEFAGRGQSQNMIQHKDEPFNTVGHVASNYPVNLFWSLSLQSLHIVNAPPALDRDTYV